MASLFLLRSTLDTKCLGLFSSPMVIKCDCELQLVREYFTLSSSASQAKAKLSWKQNPSCVPSPAHRSLPLAEKRVVIYLTGGIYWFVALKVKSADGKWGRQLQRDPCVWLRTSYAVKLLLCLRGTLRLDVSWVFDLESDSFSSSQEKRQNIWYVVWYLIYHKIFVLKASCDLKFEVSTTGY